MRIGIDATAIPYRRTGAGNYIFQLITHLAKLDQINTYVIFAKPKHVTEWKVKNPNFIFIECALDNRGARLVWEQTGLPQLVRRYHLDVLHSPHYTMPLLAGCPSVVTFHDMIFFLFPEFHTRLRRIFFSNMMRLSARRAKAIMTVSQSTADDLHRILGVPRSHIHPVLLAADDLYAPIESQAEIDEICSRYKLQQGRYIAYVGVLEPRKNISSLLAAYRNLHDLGFEQTLAIIGKRGWMFESVFQTVQELELQPYVTFTDYVPDEYLPHLYNGAAAFVYPSQYEGFGLPVLEAMACGTPVVTSNVSSMPEIVGRAGMLIDPTNIVELTDALALVLSQEELRKSLRARGLARAAQFSWATTAQQTLQVYERVFSSSR